MIEGAITCYSIAFFCELWALFAKRKVPLISWGRVFFLSGFSLLTFFLIHRGMMAKQFPWLTSYETSLFFSWSVVSGSLAAAKGVRKELFHLAVTGVACLLLGNALWYDDGINSLSPVHRSGWFWIHRGFSLLSYGVLAISFIAGALYLGYERRRRLEKRLLRHLVLTVQQTMSVGFLLLTAGIMAGVVWVNEVLGEHWRAGFSEIWVLTAWVLYAGYLHLVLRKKCRVEKGPWVSIAGFFLLWMTF